MPRRARLLNIGIVFAVFAACASPPHAGVPSQSATGPIPSPVPVHGATQSWRSPLPAGWTLTQARIAGRAIVVGGESAIRVLDAESGRLRWRSDGMASAIVPGDAVVYGTNGGAVVSRALADGRLRWRRDGVCSPPSDRDRARVSKLVRNADDIVAACSGGGLTRIAAATGHVLARAPYAFAGEDFRAIVPLPACALSASGWSSGAIIRLHAAILDCKRLRPIVAEADETVILGAVGTTVVLDQKCCSRRPDVYRSATIVRANLVTGARAPDVDLWPEPERHPAYQWPMGQGSQAFLDGSELYLAVDRTLYGYGDPRRLPASPRRIDADLVDFPTVLAHGLMAVRARAAGGGIVDEVVRIRNGALQSLWREPESGIAVFGYDADATPGVLTISRTDGTGRRELLRLPGGPELWVTDPCRAVAANTELVVTICTTNELVGNRYLQYVASYRWSGS